MTTVRELLKPNKIIKIAAVLLLLCLFSFLLCADFEKTTEYSADNSYDVSLSTVTPYNYSVFGNTFIPTAPDPRLTFPCYAENVNCIYVKLSEPLKKSVFCQAYYFEEGDGTDERISVSLAAQTGDDEIVFILPEGEYVSFRVDIEDTFSIESLQMREVTKISHTKLGGFNYVLFIILFLLSCSIAVLTVFYEENVIAFVRKTIKLPWFPRLCASILFGLISFHLLSAFWNQFWFVSDEAEIFMHGQAIANGQLLYRDTASQHTPLMYYISAFFSLMGVTTITGFRLCFYALISALWAIMYYRYSPRRGKLAVVLYPLLYIFFISQLTYAETCILSDQFQGLGMVILFYEFLEFNEKRTLGVSNCIMISLSVLISFGSAFVAAFAICVMALTVVSLDVWGYFKNKTPLKEAWSELWRRYLKLAGIVLAPMALICAFYIISGTMDDFIAWAYTLNRTTYAEYLDGYGNSIIDGFFGGRVHFIDLLKLNGLNVFNFSKLFLLLMAVAFLISIAKKGNGSLIRVLGLILFAVSCATRGLLDFHGLPALALLCAMSASFVGGELYASVKNKALPLAALCLCLITFAVPYFDLMYTNAAKITFDKDVPVGSTAWYVDKITEDGERVGFSTLNCEVMVLGKVVPATVHAGSVPWFWDFSSEEVMQELNEDPPRVFLFYNTHKVWGYSITEYAPELTEFVNSNYTSLEFVNQSMIWVHNSYIEEVTEKINNGSYFDLEPNK